MRYDPYRNSHGDFDEVENQNNAQQGRLVTSRLGSGWDALSTFGVLTAAISLTNLIIAGFRLGASSIFDRLLSTYVWLMHDVLLGFIENLIWLDIPDVWNDVIILWLVCAFISVRTIMGVRRASRVRADNDFADGKVKLGNVEAWLFELPPIVFFILVTALNTLFWPLAFVRYIYGNRELMLRLPLIYKKREFLFTYIGRVQLEAEFENNSRSYRTFWLEQIGYTIAVVILLLVANAGLGSFMG